MCHSSRLDLLPIPPLCTQELVRATIKDQIDATKIGLEHLQENSRKHALEVILQERDGEYQTALAEFNTGVSASLFPNDDY